MLELLLISLTKYWQSTKNLKIIKHTTEKSIKHNFTLHFLRESRYVCYLVIHPSVHLRSKWNQHHQAALMKLISNNPLEVHVHLVPTKCNKIKITLYWHKYSFTRIFFLFLILTDLPSGTSFNTPKSSTDDSVDNIKAS